MSDCCSSGGSCSGKVPKKEEEPIVSSDGSAAGARCKKKSDCCSSETCCADKMKEEKAAEKDCCSSSGKCTSIMKEEKSDCCASGNKCKSEAVVKKDSHDHHDAHDHEHHGDHPHDHHHHDHGENPRDHDEHPHDHHHHDHGENPHDHHHHDDHDGKHPHDHHHHDHGENPHDHHHDHPNDHPHDHHHDHPNDHPHDHHHHHEHPAGNQHHHHHHHHNGAEQDARKANLVPHGKPDCIAIVRPNGTHVDVYDVSGNCRTFRTTLPIESQKLCFSSHGHKDIDRFLTPCFDSEGKHGEPQDDCYCGENEPHLHAHLQNEATCGANASQKYQLASVTLKAAAAEALEEGNKLPVSASFPTACNSRQVAESLSDCEECVKAFNGAKQRLSTKIVHDDHVDVLVHNPETGLVTLEHDCENCGDVDVHGTFDYAAQRFLFSDKDDEEKGKKIQINFYEIPQTPMKLLDVLGDFFALEDDKAQVMRAAFPTTASSRKKRAPPCCQMDGCCADEACSSAAYTAVTLEEDLMDRGAAAAASMVKSTFFVKGICCAAEIPMVNSVVQPLQGVANVSIVTMTKLVHVMHDPSVITAQEILHALNQQRFNAVLKKDGGAAAVAKEIAPMGNGTSGRSTFFVSGICCSSEIPAINDILEPLKGVEKVSINVANKMVYVEHVFDLISAQNIKEALDREHFFTKVEKDAQATSGFHSKYVESTILVSSLLDTTDSERIKAMLQEHYSKEELSHTEVHVPSKTIKLDHNPKLLSAEDLKNFLQDSAGLELTLIADGFKEGIWSAAEDDSMEEQQVCLKWPVVLSGIFWVVSMLHYVGGNWEYLKYTGVVSVLLGIPGIGSKAFLTLKRCQFDTNCMMLFATVGALALQEFSEAAAVTFLFSISDWLESLSSARARNALSAIVKLRPERAKVKDAVSGKFVHVPASSVPTGSIVSVRTGDKIPCDGVVLEGSSVVDESSLTGESRPVRKVPGAE
eukprot:scaffold8755_cov145-Cylindrotheca_fusiformis.AAC.4